MTDAAPCETFTPCFDWVIEATGSQQAALAYGVVWRYAQMEAARCYASCGRLARRLAWSRQTVMRHLQRLVELGLVECINPGQPGVPREYVPVNRECWLARQDAPQPERSRQAMPRPGREPGELEGSGTRRRRGARRSFARNPGQSRSPDAGPRSGKSVEARIRAEASASPPAGANSRAQAEPVTGSHTPCRQSLPVPVAKGDTRETTQHTKKRRGAIAPPDPRLALLRKLTGRFPPNVLRDQLLTALGPDPDEARLASCYAAWCARGYNPLNYAWLLDWYVRGEIGPPRNGASAPPAPDASPEAFARWHAYQIAIQGGEEPDEARRRLDL